MEEAAPGAEPRHATAEEDLVALDQDHPGFRDPVYRARRNAIARLALDHVLDAPVPRIEYTREEHAVWRLVWRKLTPLHDRYACREYLESRDQLRLDRAQIPQLEDVN